MSTTPTQTPSLIDEIAGPATLWSAFAAVVARSRRDRSAATAAHIADPAPLVASISARLTARTYAGDMLTPISVGGPGRVRQLHLPTFADRIVETALLTALDRRIDPLLGPTAMAYRKGASTAAAATVAAQFRDEGFGFALRTDIASCFDTIPRSLVTAGLRAMGIDEEGTVLIATLMNRLVRGATSGDAARGIPQGAPLSPLLCNVALDALDQELAKSGLVSLRYADDLLIGLRDNHAAAESIEVVARHVHDLGMELKPDKVDVMSFADGFTFLGREIDTDTPAAEHRTNDKRVLYVARPRSYTAVRAGRVRVTEGGTTTLDVPQTQVGRIVCFGPVGVSGGLRQWALNAGVDLVFLSNRGKLLGTATSGAFSHVRRRMRQYDTVRNAHFARTLAQRMITGKILNSRALLRRYAHRSQTQAAALSIDELQSAAASAATARISSLLGIEGNAARSYWAGFASLLPCGLEFPGRRKRPPSDAVNAALSLMYTLLTAEAVGALAAVGLDPAAGVLHRPHGSMPALALDLIEEFRALVVDTTVLEMARRRMLDGDTVEPRAEGGVRFVSETLRRVFRRYESRMTTVFHHVPTGRRCSYRRALHLQAQAIGRCIRDRDASYTPTPWRV